jgi:hypothetical protein
MVTASLLLFFAPTAMQTVMHTTLALACSTIACILLARLCIIRVLHTTLLTLNTAYCNADNNDTTLSARTDHSNVLNAILPISVQAVEAQFELQAFAPLQPRRNRLCFRECGLTLGIQSACAVLPMDGLAESGMISLHTSTYLLQMLRTLYGTLVRILRSTMCTVSVVSSVDSAEMNAFNDCISVISCDYITILHLLNVFAP